MIERIERARRRYVAAYQVLVDRYGPSAAEELFEGLSGPGRLSATTPEQNELQAQRAEDLVKHCDRVDAMNLRRRDLAELVDADRRLPLIDPWKLHSFGIEIDAEEALTDQMWREARSEMEFLERAPINSQATNRRR